MNSWLEPFLEKVFSVDSGEGADSLFDRIVRGVGILTAIYFLFHKISLVKIEAIPNEVLVATLLTYGWSDSTTRLITYELVKRRHFLSWYVIRLSGVDPNDLGKRALREMAELAQSADEHTIVAQLQPPLLRTHIKNREEIFRKFIEEF